MRCGVASAFAWPAYVTVTIAGLLSQYPFIGVLVTQNLRAVAVIWAGTRRKEAGAEMAQPQLVIAAGCLPWIVYYLRACRTIFVPAGSIGLAEVAKLYWMRSSSAMPPTWTAFGPFVVACLGWACWARFLIRPLLRRREAGLVFGLAGLAGGVGTQTVLVWVANLPTRYKLSFTPSRAISSFRSHLPWR